MTVPAHARHDVVLYGHSVGYERVGGPGPTVLMVHGIGASCASWEPVIDLMAQRGLDVVAVDLPGHGRSARGRRDYSLGAMANTLRDLLDHLRVDSCVVVGHSLGGGVALQMAYQYPERVRRLVLVASGGLGEETFPLLRAASLPGAELTIPVLTSRWSLAALSWLGSVLGRVGLHPDALSDSSLTTLRELADPATRSAFLTTLRGVVDVSGQRVSAVPALPAAGDLPVLLVWGDHDQVIPLAHGQQAMELLGNARLVVFPGAGHEPHRFDPERFADLVAEFTA